MHAHIKKMLFYILQKINFSGQPNRFFNWHFCW